MRMHIHLLQGRFELAREDYTEESAIEPNSMLPMTLLAQIALFENKYAEAREIYERLLAINPSGLVNFYGSISYLSALGFLDGKAGQFESSRRRLEEAAKLHLQHSDGPQSAYDLAAIRACQNRREEAMTLLRQAIASGWMDYRTLLLDPRFENLHGLDSFRALTAALKERVETLRLESQKLCAAPLNLVDHPVDRHAQ